MVKSVYTVSIKDYSLYEETGEIKYLLFYPSLLPIYSRLAPKKLKNDLSELFISTATLLGGMDLDTLLQDDNYKLFLMNKQAQMSNVSMAILLYLNTKGSVKRDKLGKLAIKAVELNQEMKDIFEEECFREFKGTMDDYKSFSNRLEFWVDKFEEEVDKPTDMESPNQGRKISTSVPIIEKIIGPIDRDLPLYVLEGYMDAALKMNTPDPKNGKQ